MNRNQRWAKKPTKKRPDFIYNGDNCFFKKPITVYPAEQDWNYTTEIMRVIWPGEPLTYIKRMRKGRGGPWLHCFESYGLQYVYEGSIKDFTKEVVPYKEGWPDDE